MINLNPNTAIHRNASKFFAHRYWRAAAAALAAGVFASRLHSAAVDIVIDQGHSGLTENGSWWNANGASQHHGSMSRYAIVGGAVDRATFRPVLPEAGSYEVFIWNAYYANRPTNVPHRIVHRDGTVDVPVNQSGSGTFGQWLSLGWYNFDAGSSGYVEVSDGGLTSTYQTYIGADAVRFTKPDGAPPPPPPPPPPPGASFTDNFGEEVTPLDSSYTTFNPAALPIVGRKAGRYYAELTSNNNNVTVFFNQGQGRFDAQLTSFPFEAIVRNVGIGRVSDSQTAPAAQSNAYTLAGLMVHAVDWNQRNSSFMVVGHRGSTPFTVEGKNTVNGTSHVTTLGSNQAPTGRADLRIVGNVNRTLTAYWQQPNPNPGVQTDNWIPYAGTGALPGPTPAYGDQVYVGLITFASGTIGLPFVGTADGFQITQ